MSTVPAAKASLLALMEAWTWPATQPAIRWGGPTETEDFPRGGELIYFGDTEITDEAVTLGDTRIDETYNLRVVIDVALDGDNEQAAEQRAWDLYASLVSLLNQHRTFDGAINRLVGRTVRQTNVPMPQKWLARIIVDQACVGMVFNP